MSDEMKELTGEELEKVAGGAYIVRKDGDDEGYEIYKENGELIGFFKSDKEAIFHVLGKGTCPYCGKVLS